VRVRWTHRSLRSLDEITDHIARERPAAARTVAERIFAAIDRLGKHPASGRPGRVSGTRELVVPGTPFIVPYRVRDEVVEVLHVFHGARRWPDDFPD